MTPTIAALIPAAGAGTRLGLGPKALVKVAGKSLLVRSIEALAPHVNELVVALPPHLTHDIPAWQENPISTTPQRYIAGGETRQQSVLALLEACEADLVIIHDAARPFLQATIIQTLINTAQEYGAATAALPVADTLVKSEQNDHWGQICPREGLWAVQTPQVFNRQLLLEAHQQALADGFIATDDAGVVARTGHQVHLVHGDARMFKVTTPSDLALAEALANTQSTPTIQTKQPTTPTQYFAPAKVNLGLSVLGVRPDHYHELHSLMVPLSIGDVLEIEPAKQLSLEVKEANLPTNEENLVYRAAHNYLQHYQQITGQTHGAHITLHKHLPLASGLGGGSSDAATTLLALNKFYPAPIDLPALALQLGADVPFFLLQQAALAEGVGEQLTPVHLPSVWLVLVNPGIEVSAGDAYQWLDATEDFSTPLDLVAITEALQQQNAVPYWNTLQAPTLAKHPEIQVVLDALLKAGLHSPLMSGSGSTCFALAQNQVHAEQVATQLTQQHAHWWVRSTQTLSHSSEIQQQLRILC